MITPLKPMDVYSQFMDIPFNIAAYCRGHKLSPEAVRYARAIRAREAAEQKVADAQKEHDNAMALLAEAEGAVVAKMERDPL